MKKPTSTKLMFVVTAAGLLAGCRSDEKAKEITSATARTVQLETVRLQSTPNFYESTGTVRSATSSVIAAQISGTVLEMRVKAGDRVKRGQVLAVLDDRIPRAQLAAAQAGVEEASQGLAEVEQALQAAAADRQFAEATYHRYQTLLAKNSLSRQEFEGAESRYKAALANERALQAKARQAEARAQQARSQQDSAHTFFSYSRAVAPIDGIVTARSVDPGTVVMPGTPLVSVEDPGRYRLEASLPELYLANVNLGMSVDVKTSKGVFRGHVTEVVPTADTSSRTFLIKIDLPPDCGCRSGEYGTASVLTGQEQRLTVPRTSVLEQGELEGVFVADPRGIVEFRLVKTGKELGDRIEILSGLAEGERVVISQVEKLRNGAKVEE